MVNHVMKIQLGAWRWACKSWIFAAFIAFFLFFCLLGNWQLGRAEQKRALLTQQALAQQGPEFIIDDTMIYDRDQRFKRVTLSGVYDHRKQFLVDNQVMNRRAGYFVLTPFQLARQNKAVLVNRGWLPASYDRSVLPDLSIAETRVSITGRIDNFPSVGLKLAGAEIPGEGWPSVLQHVDSGQVSTKLGYPIHEFQVQLDAEMADGYQRSWQTVLLRMPPEKHTVYALQWFSFAMVLTIIFLVLTVKRVDNESESNT